jgi:membrane protease YdiL (CAAX protease family)
MSQIVNAAAFGFLMCALMVTTGNIWISVLMHGLNDTPYQFEKTAVTTSAVTGGANWGVTAIFGLSYIFVGCWILRLKKMDDHKKTQKILDSNMMQMAQGNL